MRSWAQRAKTSAEWAAGVPLTLDTAQGGRTRVHAGGYAIRAIFNPTTWEATVGLHRYQLDRDTTLRQQASECRIGASLLLCSYPTGQVPLDATQEAARLHAIANVLADASPVYDPEEN